jgi:hypothetical protein
MGKNQDPGSGINIPDLQHWFKAIHLSTVYSQDSEIPLVLVCDTEDWLFSDKHITPNSTGLWVSPGESFVSG